MEQGLSIKKRNTVLIVTIIGIIFLFLGILLGIWATRQMRTQVTDQFNNEQLVIARSTAGLIEREFDFLKKEVLHLAKHKALINNDIQGRYDEIQDTFIRILERGVWKIEIIDPQNHQRFEYLPYRYGSVSEISDSELKEVRRVSAWSEKDVWVSRPNISPSDITLIMATLILKSNSTLLRFHIKLKWLLTPFLKDIRSGKMGYAWIIDEKGVFLFHPDAEYIGEDAFSIRHEKYPNVSYEKINAIQKDKMLKGKEGTSWYYSGWHRGITGQLEKLVAYCPIMISENPLQRWSIAVTAPVSEVEQAVKSGYMRLFFFLGLIVAVILIGAVSIIYVEKGWSGLLEQKVESRTAELKRSEERYRSLIESAEDFIFTVDANGRFQSMNSFTANFFGGGCEDFLGKDLYHLFPKEVSEKQLNTIHLVYQYGKSVREEFEIQLGEHEIWLNANFMPLKNDAGEVSSVLCIARDITENKILERQLINTEKLASMGTLAAGVAHEINNPIGVILGFCSLLLNNKKPGTQEYEDLKIIERQGIHCKEIVENLLMFARFEKGNSDYADINQCLRDIIKVVNHTLEMKEIVLKTELSENLPLVKGDNRQLQQVFLNLIGNAVAAMDNGGMLRIASKSEKSKRKVTLLFEDTGSGIREEHMDRIFEPFFTTKPEGEGTGLGLFVSYGIIHKFGGTIDCVSHRSDNTGKSGGTTFIIKLPFYS